MTNTTRIAIENLKCGGCEKSILNGLAKLPGVSDVKVDHVGQWVEYSGAESLRADVAEKLLSMGYPEKDTLSGLSAGVTYAKSFVSCAIGRVS